MRPEWAGWQNPFGGSSGCDCRACPPDPPVFLVVSLGRYHHLAHALLLSFDSPPAHGFLGSPQGFGSLLFSPEQGVGAWKTEGCTAPAAIQTAPELAFPSHRCRQMTVHIIRNVRRGKTGSARWVLPEDVLRMAGPEVELSTFNISGMASFLRFNWPCQPFGLPRFQVI